MKTTSTNRKEMWNNAIRNALRSAVLLMTLGVMGVTAVNAQQAIPTLPATIYTDAINEYHLRGPALPPTVTPVTPAPNQTCPTLGNVFMIDKTHNLICVGWDRISNFDSIMFRYAETGTSNYRTIAISGTPNPGHYFIQGLIALTSYDIEVNTRCITGATSTWAHALTISTFSEPAPRFTNARSANKVYINPNPANGHTTLSFTAAANVMHQVMIVSPAGREYLKMQVSSADGKIQMPVDVSNYPPGIYFVQVQSGINYTAATLIVQ